MTLGFRLALLQTLQSLPPNDPDCYWDRNYTFNVEIAGKSIDYVFAPQTFFDENADGSKLGWTNGEHIFINKGIHPTVVPFVCWFLYHQKMSTPELREELGQEQTEGMSLSDMNTILMDSMLRLGEQYLRARQMAELITKVKDERCYDPNVHDEMFRDLVDMYSAENRSTDLVRREDASMKFYMERITEMVKAHHSNKYVRRSRFYNSLPARVQKRGCLDSYVVKADMAMPDITTDHSLDITRLIEFVRELKELPVTDPASDGIEIGPDQSRFLYYCWAPIEADTNRLKTAPFILKDGRLGTKDEAPTNLLFIRPHGQRYFESLEKRLVAVALRQEEKERKQLEAIGEVVTRLETGGEVSDVMRAALQKVSSERYAQEQAKAALVRADPIEGAHELTDRLEQRREHQLVVITGASKSHADMRKAVKARRLLEELGLNTAVVETVIAAYAEEETEALRQVVNGAHLLK